MTPALNKDELHFVLLVKFALWLSPVWDENNSDDVDAAGKCVMTFLEEQEKSGSGE